MQKAAVYKELHKVIEEKIKALQILLEDLTNAVAGESKSSAGDKHETATSMAQLEQEKISKQLLEFKVMQNTVMGINPASICNTIQTGSLVKTNRGWYYFSVGIGPVKVNADAVFCLTLASPIGQLLKGKKSQDEISFNGNNTKVLEVY